MCTSCADRDRRCLGRATASADSFLHFTGDERSPFVPERSWPFVWEKRAFAKAGKCDHTWGESGVGGRGGRAPVSMDAMRGLMPCGVVGVVAADSCDATGAILKTPQKPTAPQSQDPLPPAACVITVAQRGHKRGRVPRHDSRAAASHCSSDTLQTPLCGDAA